MLLYSVDDRTCLLFKYPQVFIIIRIVVASQWELLPNHDAQLVANIKKASLLVMLHPIHAVD